MLKPLPINIAYAQFHYEAFTLLLSKSSFVFLKQQNTFKQGTE